MKPVIGIIDDFDRPEAACLVVIYGDGEVPQAQYINAPKRPLPKRTRPGMPVNFTPIDRFGVTVSLGPAGELMVVVTGKSSATYPDGVPRSWQGNDVSFVPVRPKIAVHVRRAVSP